MVEFPLSPIKSKEGIVPEPIIPIQIKTKEGFQFYDFLVDSGADFTLLPYSLAKLIGINLKKTKKAMTQGIEGKGIITFQSSITIKIGKWEDTIRCAFASHDHIPLLLGRLDVFSIYNITFHARKQAILFDRASYMHGAKRYRHHFTKPVKLKAGVPITQLIRQMRDEE